MLLVFGTILVILGLLVAWYVAIARRPPERRLAEEYAGTGVEESEGGSAWLASVANQAAVLGEELAARGGQDVTLDARLDAAGLSMRSGELLALVAASSLAAAMFGFLLLGGWGFVIGLILPIALAPSILNYLRDRRRRQFADQLGDTLVLLSSSLRAGYGIVQAVDAVARESDDPMASEMGRVVTESRLGRDLSDALRGVVQRTGSDDFEWVVEAIEIHREVGGDLTEVLDHVGETIRARTRLARLVRSLSAEGRMSAIVLCSLPFAIGAFIGVTNPDYLEPLFDTTSGKVMLLVAGGLLLAGGLWLRKIVKPEF
jgi:tight adherence protein B